MKPEDEETIYDGPRFSVHRATFPGDRTREWVDAPDSVAIVAYDDEHVYLVRQPREAVRRDDVLEVPAGIMDVEGETPLATAKRELVEEIGMEAATWSDPKTFYTSIGFVDEKVHVFLATDLHKVGDPDESGEEQIELVPWPLRDLDRLIDQNEDSKTLVGLLWLARAR
jgi:8-oxo-dGTP pyrophosphatase MutT (NUDIX family)